MLTTGLIDLNIGREYFSVNPITVKSHHTNVFTVNRRAYTFLKTNHFGTIGFVSIGATCVGSIKTLKSVGKHKKGDYILDDDEEIKIIKEGITIHISEILDEKKKKKKKRKKAGSESSKESSLRDWFGRKGAKGKKGGWVDCNTCRKDKKSGRTKCKACGREKGEKRSKYPACRPTPSACKERGRGKSWGKKTAKGKKG